MRHLLPSVEKLPVINYPQQEITAHVKITYITSAFSILV